MSALALGSWVLAEQRSGLAAVRGQFYKDFRGEVHVLLDTEPPRHTASEGHVLTDHGRFYASVIGLHYLWIRQSANDLAGACTGDQPVAKGAHHD